MLRSKLNFIMPPSRFLQSFFAANGTVSGFVLHVFMLAGCLVFFSGTVPVKKEGGLAVTARKFKLDLHFENTYERESVRLLDTFFVNHHGQRFSLSKIRYYIGHPELVYAGGRPQKLGDYWLVDEEVPDSRRISIACRRSDRPVALRFTVGVDSIDNVSGARGGALDPANGMFWAWNTGYVFFKLEGRADASPEAGQSLQYHIGGFAAPHNAIRRIELPLSFTEASPGTEGMVITVGMDVNELLCRDDRMDFRTMPVIADPRNAFLMADRFSAAFYLKSAAFAKK